MPKQYLLRSGQIDFSFFFSAYICSCTNFFDFTIYLLSFFSLTDTNLPQLIYLRNRLWSEIFKLLSVLTLSENRSQSSDHSDEALKILTETIDEAGKRAFIGTLCEATKSLTFNGTDFSHSTPQCPHFFLSQICKAPLLCR